MTGRTVRPLAIFSQLYIGDYFGDTLSLSDAEHDAFRLILMQLWLTSCRPASAEQCAIIIGRSTKTSHAILTLLSPMLDLIETRISECKQVIASYDGHRLPPICWKVVRAVVLERDGHTCAYCGSEDRLHVDHRISLNSGGSNSFENLVTSCSVCNLSKGPKSLAQWGGELANIIETAPRIWENARPVSRVASKPEAEVMPIKSAGILLYRYRRDQREVLLVHMGGPFWAKKDAAAWSIPKGIIQPGEDPLSAARREFGEETGLELVGEFQSLGTFRQNSTKDLLVWSVEGEFDPRLLKSNTFSMTWPPKSGRVRDFPEVDRCEWFTQAEAVEKIVKGQRKVLEEFFKRGGMREGTE